MRTRNISTIFLSLALILLLAACGTSGAENEAAESGGSAGPPLGQTTGDAGENAAAGEETDEAASAEAAVPVAEQTGTAIDVAPGSEETGPKGLPVGFTSDGFAFRGNPAAPVVMEEFSDFQCPFCGRFFDQTLPSLEENQIAAGDVVLVFYDFPLKRIHPQAETAHVAAYCAGEEGAAAYWAMHDTLFANLNEWSNQGNAAEIFAGYGDELGLDGDAFATCMEGDGALAQVQKGLDMGLARGVNSTPSFFLNDQPLTGAQPLATFNSAIATILEGGTVAAEPAAPEQQDPGAIPTPATLTDEFAAAKGDPNAPVKIVEFTDYECPYCARYVEETLPGLLENYIETGQVYYQLKDFPLDNLHPQARAAAAAARCAGEQEAYWEMHDELFATQPVWSEEGETRQTFMELAAALELEGDTFETCLDSGRYDEAIATNLDEGASLGVQGTPSFFVDGFPIRGAQPLELFDYAIGLALDGELAQAYAPRPTPTPAPNTPVEVPIGDAPSVGEPDAPVTIVEYTDYQCPYCSRHFEQTYPQIMENMVETGQVRYVFKDFPLTNIHPQATDAAEAARCARDQEAFLEMHDMLFARQGEWAGQGNAIEIFIDFADDLGLDTETFGECLNSNRYEEAVLAELQEGAELGVTGTPGFFVNGYLISGAQPYQVFEQAVQELSSE